MAVVALYNLKGGVGKSTTAVTLAHLSARGGARALLWDLDTQGAAGYLLGAPSGRRRATKTLLRGETSLADLVVPTPVPNLDLVPADRSSRNSDAELAGSRKPERRLGRLLRPLAESYDTVFLDCPPTMSMLAEAVVGATDLVLVPLVPSPLSVRGLDRVARFVEQRADGVAVRGFFTMVDGRRRLHQEITARLPGTWPGVLSTRIPMASAVERMGTERAPLATFAPASPAAMAYEVLWWEVQVELRQAAHRNGSSTNGS
jgi:chromosome partitioning protein